MILILRYIKYSIQNTSNADRKYDAVYRNTRGRKFNFLQNKDNKDYIKQSH